jgi:hypothetical protein
MQASWSLQQLPSQAPAVFMLALSLFEVAQPVDRRIPTAQTVANVSIFFIAFSLLVSVMDLVFSSTTSLPPLIKGFAKPCAVQPEHSMVP